MAKGISRPNAMASIGGSLALSVLAPLDGWAQTASGLAPETLMRVNWEPPVLGMR